MNDFDRARFVVLMLAALCLYACLLAVRALTAAKTAYDALDNAETHLHALTLENHALYGVLARTWRETIPPET